MNNLYLTSSFRYPSVAELVMDNIEKQLQKSPSDIKVAHITTAGNLHPVDQPMIFLNDNQLVRVKGDSFQIWEV